MSAKIQQLRDRLERGMSVTVVDESNGRMRRRRGRVLEIVRAAARILVEDETHARLVRFAQIELDAPDRDPSESASERASKAVTLVRPVEPAPATAPPLAASSTSARERETALDAWIAMGAEIESELTAQLAACVEQAKALEDERAALDSEIASNSATAERLRKQLARVRSVREVGR